MRKELGEEKFKEEIENFAVFAGGYDKNREKPLFCGLKNGKIHFNNRGTMTNHEITRSHTKFKKLNFKRSIKLMKKDIDNYSSDHDLN